MCITWHYLVVFIHHEVGHELRSSTEHENGQMLLRFVGCGEFTNRIEGMRVTTDAVPVGQRILHRIFEEDHEGHEVSG